MSMIDFCISGYYYVVTKKMINSDKVKTILCAAPNVNKAMLIMPLLFMVSWMRDMKRA